MGKKTLKEHEFHSKELLPWDVAILELDKRDSWIADMSQAHRFKRGDDVAHKNNPELRMTIREIIKENVRIRSDVVDEEGEPVYITRRRLLGIRCHYWE